MLYAHDPASLLPLLRSYLPYSISIVASILANADNRNDADADADDDYPSSNPHPAPLDAVYTTFPASSLPSPSSLPPTPWLATLAIPAPYTQTRTFHTFESLPPSQHTADAYADAQAMVVAAWAEMARIYPLHLKGAVHALWGQAVREAMEGVDRGLFTVYYASTDAEEEGGWEGQWGGKAESNGETYPDELVLDHGRAGDEQLFYKHNQYRTPEFYASRLGDTTVLRPNSTSPTSPTSPTSSTFSTSSTSPTSPTATPLPIAWIVTLTDGSQGTLFTLPSHRRRGLAKLVVAARLRACRERALARGGGQDGHGEGWLGWPGSYAAVAPGNTASEALWSGVGWVRGWDVTYVMRGEALLDV